MNRRALTGKWYLEKRIFGGLKVMVQVEVEDWCDPSYGNGGGCYAPKRIEFQKAKPSDLVELNIVNNIFEYKK